MSQNSSRSTAMSADVSEMIREPTACPKCSYDLQGLFVGMLCPECGTAITRRKKFVDDHMGNAPEGYLNTLAGALLVFGLAGLLVPIGALLDLVGASTGRYVALASIAVLPVAGFIILRKRDRPHLKLHAQGEGAEWRELRIGCVVGYGFMYLLLLAFILEISKVFVSPGWVYTLLFSASGIGICLAAWHISLLADWARDEGRAQQLRACSMGFGLYLLINFIAFMVNDPLGGLFGMAYATEGLGVFLMLLTIMVSLVAFGCLLLIFLYSMLLASTVRWSIRNARTERERDQRIAERARQRAEEMAAKTAEASVNASRLFVAPDPKQAGVNLIDSGSDVEEPEEDDEEYNPYQLED